MKKLPNIDYSRIDKRMVPLIRMLRDNGFNTFACCEGGRGHPDPKAWIRVTLPGKACSIEKIPIGRFPKGMSRWYSEYERIAKFVYTKTDWSLCEVKLFSMPAFDTGDVLVARYQKKEPPPSALRVWVCIDIEFDQPLRKIFKDNGGVRTALKRGFA